MKPDTVATNLRHIGRSLASAGAEVVYYYPGMRGDLLAHAIVQNVRPSLNERNAFEFAYGASLAGGRSVAIFKGVGLAATLDSVHHAVINGVGGGMVIVVLEDTVAHSSPEIIDSRVLNDYIHALILEPATIQSAVDMTAHVFELSEQLDLPIILRITYDLLQSSSPVDTDGRGTVYATPPVVMPRLELRQKSIGAWSDRVERFERKQAAIHAYVAQQCAASSVQDIDGIVFGAAQPTQRALTIQHYPIPAVVRALFSAQPGLMIRERGSNYAERALRSNLESAIDSSIIHEGIASVMHDWDDVLRAINKVDYAAVIGDEGKYTSDSFGLIDGCLCMGSSISVAAGASLYAGSRTMAIIGDFAYQFNGYVSIVEAAARHALLDIVLLDDRKASSTGGQDALTPIDTNDVASHIDTLYEYAYAQPPKTISANGAMAGITLYRVKK